jgi:hypothetical protein
VNEKAYDVKEFLPFRAKKNIISHIFIDDIINIGESSGLRFADHNIVISFIIKVAKSLCACKYILQIG